MKPAQSYNINGFYKGKLELQEKFDDLTKAEARYEELLNRKDKNVKLNRIRLVKTSGCGSWLKDNVLE